MIGSELYFSLFVGIVLSLIFAEKFGINPAGLVVPGYLALILINPLCYYLCWSLVVSLILLLHLELVDGSFFMVDVNLQR